MLLVSKWTTTQEDIKNLKTHNSNCHDKFGALKPNESTPQEKMSHYFDSWNDRFAQLKQYKSKHGDCNVPRNYDENLSLAYWVRNQRSQFKHSKMSEERIKMLNDIGFNWYNVSQENKWIDKFEELKLYRSTHGDCNVPQKYDEHQPLARWVRHQRSYFQHSKLSEERINMLNAIGFNWYNVSHDKNWTFQFEQLKQYKSKHGDCNVPKNFDKNLPLAYWVKRQRTQFKQSKLPEERINKLNAIGFNWSISKDNFWIDKFEELKRYKSKHGNCNVPSIYNKNQPLARWVKTQRFQFKHSKVSEERVKMLNSIGFNWTLQKNMNETRQLKNHEQIAIEISYQDSKEKEEHFVNNKINTEKEDSDIEENHGQIVIETSHQDSKEKETTTKEEGEKSFKRSLQDRIEVLCTISIMFQEQKDAIYADMKRRKLGNSA